jgi:hypothetical protein
MAPMQSADAAQYRERLKSPAKAQQMAAARLQASNTQGNSFGRSLGTMESWGINILARRAGAHKEVKSRVIP